MDNLYILCTKPLIYILFQQYNLKHTIFEDFKPNVTPVFPITKSIKIKGYSMRRKQVPICPIFSITDYKVQRSMLIIAILDLKNNLTTKSQDKHKKFCSRYVQLLRLQSKIKLYLLQEININNF